MVCGVECNIFWLSHWFECFWCTVLSFFCCEQMVGIIVLLFVCQNNWNTWYDNKFLTFQGFLCTMFLHVFDVDFPY